MRAEVVRRKPDRHGERIERRVGTPEVEQGAADQQQRSVWGVRLGVRCVRMI